MSASDFSAGNLAKRTMNLVHSVLRPLIAKPPSQPATAKARTLTVIALVMEYDGELPSEILAEAAINVKDHMMEHCASLQVSDPRMAGKDLPMDCRYAIKVFRYCPTENT